MTKIQWTDETWNPLRGCSRVSEGCRNCYAEKMAARFDGPGLAYAGLTKDRKWNGRVTFIADKLDQPLHWKKPRRIFVNSMSDLFHENVPDEWIDRIFAVMALSPQHVFQVLTKRPDRMCKYLQLKRYPLPNVWLGVSVEDQETADRRIPILLDTQAAIRWVSYEPALGPVDLTHITVETRWAQKSFDALESDSVAEPNANATSLDWVVVGGESGPGARPCDLEWVRHVVQQCKNAGVPCFVKQLGAKLYDSYQPPFLDPIVKDRKGGDPSEWPEDLRVREWPEETP